MAQLKLNTRSSILNVKYHRIHQLLVDSLYLCRCVDRKSKPSLRLNLGCPLPSSPSPPPPPPPLPSPCRRRPSSQPPLLPRWRHTRHQQRPTRPSPPPYPSTSPSPSPPPSSTLGWSFQSTPSLPGSQDPLSSPYQR